MERKQNKTKILFIAFLLYEFTFYTQIAGRYPFLAPFRLEFVIGSVLLFAIIINILKKEIILSGNRITAAVIALIAVSFLSIFFAFVKRHALDSFIWFLKVSSVYFMTVACISTEKQLKVYYYFYLGLISLIFVEPFFLSLKGQGFRYANFMMRLYGVTGYFEHPNQLGGIVAANLPFFYFPFLYFRSFLMKGIFLSLMAIGVYVVMLTQSRTAFVGVMAFGFFAWVTSKHKIKTLIIAVFIAIIAWHIAPEETKQRLITLDKTVEILQADNIEDEEVRKEYGSSASRWLLFKRSLTVFFENPIIGVGIGCYSSYSGRRWHVWLETHNLYTQVLAELGILGGIAFYFFIINVLKCNRESKAILEANNDRSFLWFLCRALTMFYAIRLVIGLFGHDLYRDWWFFSSGITVVILRILKERYAGNLIQECNDRNYG